MKYFVLTIGVTATALLLYAATQTMNPTPSLNQVMTPEDQIRTGVNKLSPEERNELEEWLQTYAQTKAAKNKKNSIKPSFGHLTINVRGGQFLILMDGSVWEVAPDDIYTASAWLASIPLEITYDSSDPNNYYPYTFKNQYSGLTVRVRQASMDDIPEPTPTPAPANTTTGTGVINETNPANEKTNNANEAEGVISPTSPGASDQDQDEGANFSNPPPPPRSQPAVNRQQQVNPNQHTNPNPSGSSGSSGSTGQGTVPNFSVTTPTD